MEKSNLGSVSRYPERERMFAMKFGNLLMRTRAAMTIGADACWLLMSVALMEDATHYTRGVTFYTGQLLEILGFKKWERLDAARKRAIDEGWLHYQAPGMGKRQPGTYWVLVPSFAQKMPNIPREAYPENGDCEPDYTPETEIDKSEASPQLSPEAYPEASPEAYPKKGEPPSPHPHNPTTPLNTSSRAGEVGAGFVVPSLEAVQEFCKQENLPINVELFHGYYTENGWKKKGGEPVRDWKQCARNWYQRDLEGEKHGKRNGKRTSTNHVGPGQRYTEGAKVEF